MLYCHRNREQEIYADHFSNLQGSQEDSQENLRYSKC